LANGIGLLASCLPLGDGKGREGKGRVEEGRGGEGRGKGESVPPNPNVKVVSSRLDCSAKCKSRDFTEYRGT